MGKKMLYYANNMVKYMPIDKTTLGVLSPIFDFTSGASSKDHLGFMENLNDINEEDYHYSEKYQSAGEKKILHSGKTGSIPV